MCDNCKSVREVLKKIVLKTLTFRIINLLLPEPPVIITLDLASIIQAFQNLSYIGELRQRWNEIKKLQYNPLLALS